MEKIKPSFTFILSALLILFVLINPSATIDIIALVVLSLIVLQKTFGDYAVILLLALRPMIDIWRDNIIFSARDVDINLNAALAIILLGWSAYFLYSNRSYLKRAPWPYFWLAWLGWCAISWIFSYDRPSTMIELVKAANLFALFNIGFILRSKYKEFFNRHIYIILLVSAIIPFGLGAWQALSGAGMRIDDVANRIYGTFAHPNVLATFALLILMVSIDYLIKHQLSWRKLIKLIPTKSEWLEKLYLPVILICAGIIFFTYTRAVWIGLIIFSIIVSMRYARKQLAIAILGIALFYSLFYPVNSFLISTFNSNLQSNQTIARLTARTRESDSIKWRADLFNKVTPIFWRRPLIGYGYGSFTKVWNDNKGRENWWDTGSEAHNDYLRVAFETGFIGLALFLSIFGYLIVRQLRFGIRHDWSNIVFLASLAVYLALSLSDNMLSHTATSWWIWFIWGMWCSEKQKPS
ncbi:MAG: O-antigen ligase family protein [bacterium]